MSRISLWGNPALLRKQGIRMAEGAWGRAGARRAHKAPNGHRHRARAAAEDEEEEEEDGDADGASDRGVTHRPKVIPWVGFC